MMAGRDLRFSLDLILSEYAMVRRQAEIDRQERLLYVFSLSHIIKELHAKKESLLMNLPLAMARGEEEAVLLGDLKNIREAISEELSHIGLDPGFLDTVYRCPACADMGYVEQFGVRKRCNCLVQRMLDASYGGEPEEYIQHSFDNFDLSVFPDHIIENGMTQRQYMARLKQRLEEYSEQFPVNPQPGILLYGNTGLGKTYLLNCVRRRVMEKGYSAVRLTAFQLFDEIREIHMSRGSLHSFITPDLLIVDDLGTEPFFQNITVEYLFNVINERMQRMKHIAFATNLVPQDLLKRYGERLLSRLFNTSYMGVSALSGQDIRLRSRTERD
jgi:DNA replication protein DnaC